MSRLSRTRYCRAEWRGSGLSEPASRQHQCAASAHQSDAALFELDLVVAHEHKFFVVETDLFVAVLREKNGIALLERDRHDLIADDAAFSDRDHAALIRLHLGDLRDMNSGFRNFERFINALEQNKITQRL